MRTSAVVAASAGTIVTGLLAYALYFDYKRQSDPEFRRSLKRDNRRLARAVREETEEIGAKQREELKKVLAEAQEDGFPVGLEEKEGYFMEQVAKGEALCTDSSSHVEAALSFYKALKVYPAPKDLLAIYDRTVPKDVLELLAELIALDPSIKTGTFTGGDAGSDSHSVE